MLSTRLLLLVGVVSLSVFAATTGRESASAAEVPIAITVKADRVERSPITQVVQPSNTIKWTSAAVSAGDAKKIRITLSAVGGNPFVGGASFDSGVLAIGAEIPASPPVRAEAATATPNVYRYEIRVFKDDGATEIQALRESRNYIWVPGAMDSTVRVRGLFVCPTVGAFFCNNANHLRNVINDGTTGFGTNWATRPRVLPDPTAEMIKQNISGTDTITSAFAGADDNDLSVLYVTGHGNEEPNKGAIELGEWIRDSAFGVGVIGQALNRVRGNKLMVFDACLSGGMIDGKDDPPIANSVVITATDAVTKSQFSNTKVFGHPHTFLGGSLVSGFMRVKPIGPDPQPVGGVVAADPSPGAADPAVRSISVKRWFEFAKAQMGEIVALDALTKKLEGEGVSPETAQINDDFSPEKASGLIIFQYKKGEIKDGAELHKDPPASHDILSACAQCPSDICPATIGGTVELLAGGDDSPTTAADGGSDIPYATIAGGAAVAFVVFAAGGWYVRRRRVRR